jgi:hypothetical protein
MAAQGSTSEDSLASLFHESGCLGDTVHFRALTPFNTPSAAPTPAQMSAPPRANPPPTSSTPPARSPPAADDLQRLLAQTDRSSPVLCSPASARHPSEAELSFDTVTTDHSANSSSDSSSPDPHLQEATHARGTPSGPPPPARGRSVRRLPSLLARLSSVAAEGAVIAVSPSRSFRELSSRQSAARRVHGSSSAQPAASEPFVHRPRDAPENRDARSVQVLPCNPHPAPPSHSHAPPTTPTSTPATIRDSSSTQADTVDYESRDSTRPQYIASSAPQLEPEPEPEPIWITGEKQRKMHQTSSRLLRMTDDDRPFTRVSPSCLLVCVFVVPRFVVAISCHPVSACRFMDTRCPLSTSSRGLANWGL